MGAQIVLIAIRPQSTDIHIIGILFPADLLSQHDISKTAISVTFHWLRRIAVVWASVWKELQNQYIVRMRQKYVERIHNDADSSKRKNHLARRKIYNRDDGCLLMLCYKWVAPYRLVLLHLSAFHDISHLTLQYVISNTN